MVLVVVVVPVVWVAEVPVVGVVAVVSRLMWARRGVAEARWVSVWIVGMSDADQRSLPASRAVMRSARCGGANSTPRCVAGPR